MIRALLISAALVPIPVADARANTVECGGNSFSYAEVLVQRTGRPPKVPIQVVPDSLCADLIERRRSAIRSLDITIDPRTSPDLEPNRWEVGE